MSEIDAPYYNLKIAKSDPHFCTTCRTRNDDNRSLLNYVNYQAWINYGMCQKCMQHYLGFNDGLIVNSQRTKMLIDVLNSNKQLKQRMNPHLRLYLFPQQLEKYNAEQKEKLEARLKKGFTDNGNIRSCNKCGFSIVLTQSTRYKQKCAKCDHPFDIQPFQWQLPQDENERG